MRLGHTIQLPLWVVVPVIVVIIGVGVGGYQAGQRAAGDAALTPAGDQGVQIGAGDLPGSGGSVHAGDGLLAWASAAAVGDYVTARQHMEEDALLVTMWQGHHDAFVRDITGYRILSRETVGQTTTARVQFDTPGGGRCITVQLNEQTQQVRADRVYGTCP